MSRSTRRRRKGVSTSSWSRSSRTSASGPRRRGTRSTAWSRPSPTSETSCSAMTEGCSIWNSVVRKCCGTAMRSNPTSRASRTCSIVSASFRSSGSPGKCWLVMVRPSFMDRHRRHAPLGWIFALPNRQQGAPPTTGQGDWRFSRATAWMPRSPARCRNGAVADPPPRTASREAVVERSVVTLDAKEPLTPDAAITVPATGLRPQAHVRRGSPTARVNTAKRRAFQISRDLAVPVR
jgi:hypothetical protein